jgi:hypothetical protein
MLFWFLSIIMFLTFSIFQENIPTGLTNYEYRGCFVKVLPSLEAGPILERAHVCVSFYLIHFTHTVRQMNVCSPEQQVPTSQLLFSPYRHSWLRLSAVEHLKLCITRINIAMVSWDQLHQIDGSNLWHRSYQPTKRARISGLLGKCCRCWISKLAPNSQYIFVVSIWFATSYQHYFERNWSTASDSNIIRVLYRASTTFLLFSASFAPVSSLCGKLSKSA